MFGLWSKKKKDYEISLENLSVTEEDLGTSWHPTHLIDGELLEDISSEMMEVHLAKEERLSQPDAVTPLEDTHMQQESGN